MTPSNTPTRRERHTEAARQTIVAAAREVLIERGPGGFTLDAVSELADVAVQTIYNRVGNRSALLLAVTQSAFDQNQTYLDDALAATGASAVDRIKSVFDAYVRFATERPHEFRLMAHPPDDPEAARQTQHVAERQSTKLAQILREGIAEGTVNSAIDPDLAAIALWAMANGVLELQWRAGAALSDGSRLDGILAAFETIVQHGFERPRHTLSHPQP